MTALNEKFSTIPLSITDGGRRELEYKMLMEVAREKLTEEDLNLLNRRGNLKLVRKNIKINISLTI